MGEIMRSRVYGHLVVLAVVVGALWMLVEPVTALAGNPAWEVFTEVNPTTLPPGGTGSITVRVFNIGDASGEATLTDELPEGVTMVAGGGSSHCQGMSVVTCKIGLVPREKEARARTSPPGIDIPVNISGSVASGSEGTNS